jgi:hypothetical protein
MNRFAPPHLEIEVQSSTRRRSGYADQQHAAVALRSRQERVTVLDLTGPAPGCDTFRRIPVGMNTRLVPLRAADI